MRKAQRQQASKFRHIQPKFSQNNTVRDIRAPGSSGVFAAVEEGVSYIALAWGDQGRDVAAIHKDSKSVLHGEDGHQDSVLDTAWNPFDDNVFVSAGKDGRVIVWKVSDDGK